MSNTNNASSDAAYLSFLDKANQPMTSGGTASAQQQGQDQGFHASKTVDEDQKQRIPRALTDLTAYYVSDTDEPFEPVVLGWKDAGDAKWPGEGGQSTSFFSLSLLK